jgi:phage gp36-like protein
MPYITCQQIYGNIPQPKVNDALDDDGDGQADPGVLDQIIADSCQEVDGYLQGRYTVPFTGEIPSVVVQASLAFACEKIYGRREVGAEANPFTAKARVFRGTSGTPGILTKIANRDLPLDVGETESITPGAVLHEEAPINTSFR